MSAWIVITKEATGEGRSSPLFSQTHAMSYACDLIETGTVVLRVEGYGQEWSEAEIREWARERRRRLPEP